MAKSLQSPETSTVVSVEDACGSSSSSSSSAISEQPFDAENDFASICSSTENDDIERQETAPFFLSRKSSQGASSSRGELQDGQKRHGTVTSRKIADIQWLWTRNRSYVLVMIGTVFGSAMTLFTKLLETDEHQMHPFQILFFRMIVTTIICFILLHFKKASRSPFGPRELRWLLIFRGISGFFGLCGIWTSIMFLDLADATVITFLTPSMVAIFSAVFMKQPYTRKEQLASLLAMLGVVFIARPALLFGAPAPAGGDGIPDMSAVEKKKLAASRLTGTILALVSATGGAGAFISIRTIGARASILTTTLYFSMICTVISGAALLIAPLIDYDQPHVRLGLVEGTTQWMLMGGIIICGLLTQLFLTAGLSGETKSNKAPAMVYTGMLWTAGLDRWVFGEKMYWTSVMGCALIVGGAVWMVVQPKTGCTTHAARDVEVGAVAVASEEEAAPMVIELSQRDAVGDT